MGRTAFIINQYAKTPATGASNRHYALARELAARGHDVTVVAAAFDHLIARPVPMDARFRIEEQEGGFRFLWVRVPPFSGAQSAGRIRAWFSFARALPRLDRVLGRRADTVLVSSPSLIAWLGAWRLARRMRARLVFEVRDIWPLSLVEIGSLSTGHPFIRFLQWIEDRAYRHSHAVVSNLRGSVDHMVSRGLDRARFTWVPNGHSTGRATGRPAALPDDVADRLPDRPFLVGYTGTVGVANALGTVLDAAGLLRDDARIGFVIVGSGAEREALRARAQAEGLDNVAFLDPIPKEQIPAMLARFQACYIGLQNQSVFRFGVSPNKLFDYMCAGRPIIYGIDSGSYRPVSEAGAGVEVGPEDGAALADAARRLADLPLEERERMGQNALKAAEAYDYRTLAATLEGVLFPCDAAARERASSPEQATP